MNSKNRITFDMKEEDRAALKSAAESRKVSVSEFVRSAVAEAVKRVNQQTASAEAVARAVESAYSALDAQDAKAGHAVQAQPEAPKPAFPVAVTRHPCAFLDTNAPHNYKQGEIPGTCQRQGHKPCHFHGQSARNCSLFVPYFTRPNK